MFVSLDFVTLHAILCVILVALLSVTPVVKAEAKCLAVYASPPEYPLLPDGQRPEGKGLFICRIDRKTGHVTSVSIAKSTGFAILDKAAIDCFKRWRFRAANCAREVKMPITFTTHGAPQI